MRSTDSERPLGGPRGRPAGHARVAEGEWASPFDGDSLEGWTVLELRGGTTGRWEVGDGTIQGSVRQPMPFRPRGDHEAFRHRAPMLKNNDPGSEVTTHKVEVMELPEEG